MSTAGRSFEESPAFFHRVLCPLTALDAGLASSCFLPCGPHGSLRGHGLRDYLGKVLESSGDDGVRVGKVLNLVNPAATGSLSLGTAFEKKGTHD